jgi:hypothetical protein
MMRSGKATLSIVLMANDLEIARSEDQNLWHRVHGEILTGGSNLSEDWKLDRKNGAGSLKTGEGAYSETESSRSTAIDQLAQQLGVGREQLEGACSPSTAPPFIHLDVHHWEAMKNQVGRGKFAIAPVAAAATLLLLWFKKVEAVGPRLGGVTRAETRAVLSTIQVNDKNPHRSVKHAVWLQMRGSQILLNPAEISKADKLATCFCTKDWTAWKGIAKL